MILRLQEEDGKSGALTQVPFHRDGTGPRPESEKLGRSGQIPVSRTPTMTSSA